MSNDPFGLDPKRTPERSAAFAAKVFAQWEGTSEAELRKSLLEMCDENERLRAKVHALETALGDIRDACNSIALREIRKSMEMKR
jgi:hypothetical protein